MRWRSTTARFAALVFLLQVAAAATLLLAVHMIVRGQVYASAAETGEVLRQDLLAVHAQGGVAALRQAVIRRVRGDATPEAVLLLAGRDGRPLAGNLAAWPPGIGPGTVPVQAELYRRQHATPEAMLLRVTRLADGTRLLTGSVVDDERRTVRLLELAMLVALLLAIAFAALAAWLAARMIVVRLDDIVVTLDAVGRGDLSRRAPADVSGDAFAMLTTSVNATLDRVRRLMDELTMATDMLAHDLKSPLTRLHSALERAATAGGDPAAQEAIDRALAEGDRLLMTVETALRITRAEAGIGRDAFTLVNLATELEEIAEIYGPLAEDAGRDIRVQAPACPTLYLHRELLAQALANLIDNALKYGDGTIMLALDAGPDRVAVSVSDQGSGIAPEHHAAALRRFGRIDAARGGSGAGLGLSLVAAVARLHGGDIVLEDAGGGLRVVIYLPASGD